MTPGLMSHESLHTMQQTFLIICSEPCLGLHPEDEEMEDTVPALLGLVVGGGSEGTRRQ